MKTAPIRLFHHSRRDAGFSLVEVLVSVLVLTVGLVGTAVIQLNAFRTTEQSGFHNTAVAIATQIADEIRTNSHQMRLASSPFNSFRYEAESVAPADTPPVNCYKTSCKPEEWAAHSMVEWQSRVFSTLPGGRVEICRDKDVFDTVSGDFRWCGSIANPVNEPVVVKIGWDEKDPSGALVDGNAPPPRVVILVSPFTQ